MAMAQGIVDVLEAIQIQKQHADSLVRDAGAKAIAWLTRSFNSIRLGKPVRKSCSAEWVICQRHRPGRAHVAENDDRSGGLPFAVVNGGNGVFDRNFKSVTPDEDAVRRQMHVSGLCSTAISIGFGEASRLAASRIRNTSANGRPAASCDDQPVIFARPG